MLPRSLFRPARSGATLACFALALPATATAQDYMRRGPLVEALQGVECVVTAPELAGFLQSATATEADLTALADLGIVTSRADGGVELAPAYCGLGPPAALLTAALRVNGCTLGEASAEAMLPRFGLTRESSGDAVDELLMTGAAVILDEEVLMLSAEACDGAVSPTFEPVLLDDEAPLDTLLRATRDAGCRLDEIAAADLLPSYGLSMNLAESLVDALIDSGRADFEAGAIVLGEADCARAGAAPPIDVDPDLRARFLEVLAAEGCSLHERRAVQILPSYGLSMDLAEVVAIAMVGSGEGTLVDGTFSVGPEFCTPVDAAAAEEVPLSGPSANSSEAEVEAALMDLFRGAECRIALDEIDQAIETASLPLDAAQGVLNEMLGAGALAFAEGGSSGFLELSPMQCAAADDAPVVPDATD